jgi:disulfide bond formation protein DsbB
MKFSTLLSIFSMRRLLLMSAAASAAILGAALIGQYVFGLHPCELCLYQRYPYVAIMAIGLAGALLVKLPRAQATLAGLCGLLFLLDAGIAFYHTGVEWKIFPGPSACSSGDTSGMTLEEMRQQIMNAQLVPCDQPMAHFLGLSMAGWNMLLAMSLAAVVFTLLCRKESGA